MKTTYGKKRGRDTRERGRGARRQFAQLVVCVVLFLAVFVGKEVWPSKIAKTGEQLLTLIGMNTDFKGAFTRLGQAVSREGSVIGELGEFCISVFAPQPEEQADETEEPAVVKEEVQAPQEQAEPTEAEEEPRIGDVLEPAEETAASLPEGYDGRWLYLGELETATPVQGTVTSGFGYRDHPTVGRYAAHGGVDIAADRGTGICAFAAGTVMAAGEDRDFGRWLRLSHGDGVESFYAHCSEICAEAGQTVSAGQTVALVGSSGASTGPHLHFEIRLNGIRLDPLYYIEPARTL